MATHRRSPRLEYAYRWLRGRISKCARGQRLAAVRVLAAEAGVSLVTMLRAVNQLGAEGHLVVVPRGGIVVQSPSTAAVVQTPSPEPPAAWLGGWKRVAEELRGELLRRAILPGERLPSAKALAARYRASTPTIRKACAHLADRHLLARDHRWFTVLARERSDPTARILVLARTEVRSELSWMAPWSAQLWRALDIASWRNNLRVSCHSFSQIIGEERKAMRALADPLVLGVVVLDLGLSQAEVAPLCARLARYAKRVALLDEMGGDTISPAVTRLPTARAFLIGCGSLSGLEMGRFLARKGPEGVCIIAPSSRTDAPWIVERVAGLTSALGTSSIPVRPAAPASETDTADTQNEIIKQFRDVVGRFGTPRAVFDHPMTNRVLPLYAGLRTLCENLEPVFRALIAERTIDTWVGLNDDVALAALDFVRRNHARAVRRIRVAGFDDSAPAHAEDLTSYNWNVEAIVDAMLDHLLDNARNRELLRRTTIEVAGFVVERASTR